MRLKGFSKFPAIIITVYPLDLILGQIGSQKYCEQVLLKAQKTRYHHIGCSARAEHFNNTGKENSESESR